VQKITGNPMMDVCTGARNNLTITQVILTMSIVPLNVSHSQEVLKEIINHRSVNKDSHRFVNRDNHNRKCVSKGNNRRFVNRGKRHRVSLNVAIILAAEVVMMVETEATVAVAEINSTLSKKAKRPL
jgi:hypothetical protein